MKAFLTTILLLILALPTKAVTVLASGINATCGACNGSILASAFGGLPPYSFVWSPEPSSGQGTSSIQGLCPGTYTVEVTDGLGATATAEYSVVNNSSLPDGYIQEIRSACDGDCSGVGVVSQNSLGGTPPYTVDFQFAQYNVPNPGSILFGGLCPGMGQYHYTDANGCVGVLNYSVNDLPSGSPVALSTIPACGTSATGAIVMPDQQSNYAAFRVSGPGGDQVFVFQTAGPYVLDGLAPGSYQVNYWDEYGADVVYCSTATTVIIGSLPEPCGTITGRVYHDADGDCAFNGFDLTQPYRILSVEPGGHYAISDGTGTYLQHIPLGSYTIAQGSFPSEVLLCPTTVPAPFTLDATAPIATVNFSNQSTVPHDLSVTMHSSGARPGFPTQVWISVDNNSAFPSGDATLDLNFDPLLLDPSPATGQMALGVIAPYQHLTRVFTANVPADINLLGTVLSYSVNVTNTVTEPNTANNTAAINVAITGSYDPNDKQGITSSSASADQYFLNSDSWIDYTVRYQNTGTDTAFTVVIRDVIDTNFDIMSLDILGASHAFTPSFGEGRELIFTFNNILLPDSTTDLLGSQGFISYRIKPNNAIEIGDALGNTASIYFDLNDAIITNTTAHVVESSTGVQAHGSVPNLWLMPNPTSGSLEVRVSESAAVGLLQVVSVDGRVVLQRRMEGPRTVLDVSQLSRGLYTLNWHDANGTVTTQRFVRE